MNVLFGNVYCQRTLQMIGFLLLYFVVINDCRGPQQEEEGNEDGAEDERNGDDKQKKVFLF